MVHRRDKRGMARENNLWGIKYMEYEIYENEI